MHKETGRARLLADGENPTEEEILASVVPKKGCKHCYGKGYIGKEVESGEVVPCRCVMKQLKKARDKGLVK